MRRLIEMPIAVLVGVLLGLFGAVATPHIIGGMLSVYDEIFPVLTMQGRLVEFDDESVTVHIIGHKNRGEECRLVSIYGYTFTEEGAPPLDAIAERVDRKQKNVLRSKGFYDIGWWKIYPVSLDAKTVQVWTHHECVGRPILTKVAEVPINR